MAKQRKKMNYTFAHIKRCNYMDVGYSIIYNIKPYTHTHNTHIYIYI